MKIALIAFHFAEYAFRLASELCPDHTVLLVMHKENAEAELGDTIHSGIPENLEIALFVRRGPKDPLFFINVWKMIKLLRTFKPDVVHYQESLNYAFSIALTCFRNIPLVLTIHDHIAHSGAKETELMMRHRRFLRKRPDAVIVHGKRICRESEEVMPWLAGRIFSIPHGVLGETDRHGSKDWEKGALLFFGRVEKYKGIEYLVEAAHILEQRALVFRVIIAGTGSELETYKSQIGPNPHFCLIERYIEKNEIQNLFETANIVVLPYTDATQSGVAALAVRYGRPVVATDVGSVGEMVKDGFNGILVPPRNANALANAIQTLLEDNDLAGQMGRNARQLAENDLSWRNIARNTVQVYQFAVQHKEAFSCQIS